MATKGNMAAGQLGNWRKAATSVKTAECQREAGVIKVTELIVVLLKGTLKGFFLFSLETGLKSPKGEEL